MFLLRQGAAAAVESSLGNPSTPSRGTCLQKGLFMSKIIITMIAMITMTAIISITLFAINTDGDQVRSVYHTCIIIITKITITIIKIQPSYPSGEVCVPRVHERAFD